MSKNILQWFKYVDEKLEYFRLKKKFENGDKSILTEEEFIKTYCSKCPSQRDNKCGGLRSIYSLNCKDLKDVFKL